MGGKMTPRLRLYFLALILFTWIPVIHAQQPKSIGQVTALEGKVSVLRQGKFAPEPLTLHKPVFQEDIIETDRTSKVRITLSDATVISLGEQSRLEIDHQLELCRLLHREISGLRSFQNPLDIPGHPAG